MSIELDPANYTFAPPALDCAHCFPANKTPLQRIICATGIQMGTATPGVDPDPPNFAIVVTTTVACSWTTLGPVYFHGYATTGANSELNITPAAGGFFMFHGVGLQCETWFANEQDDPAIHKYYGGFATILHVQATDPLSLSILLGSLGFQLGPDTWGEDFGLAGTQSVFRYAHPLDRSNAKIKFAHP